MSKRILVALCCAALLAGCAGGPKPEKQSENHDSARVMFDPAKQAMDRGDYSTAIKLFEDLEARYPYGPYAEQAELDTAYSYYQRGESDAAVAAAERFIKLHPANPYVDYAWYLKGIAYYQAIQGAEWDPDPAEKAFATFDILVKRWPNTAYAADARQRMAKIIDILGQRNLDICKFYYVRHAYVAAADRCTTVITRYQLSPAREEALYYLARSYARMNLKELAQNTTAILAYNYPRSKYLGELGVSGPTKGP